MHLDQIRFNFIVIELQYKTTKRGLASDSLFTSEINVLRDTTLGRVSSVDFH